MRVGRPVDRDRIEKGGNVIEGRILEAEEISKRYFGVPVLHAVSLWAAAGTITSVIGPNGAGKTTLFDILTGFTRPDRGEILFAGREISRTPAHRRALLGIVRTFQIPHEFTSLTVEQNLLVAAEHQAGEHFPGSLWRFGRIRRDEAANKERAAKVLELLELDGTRDAAAGSLPLGQKKLLELGRALMLRPKVLMLDEPLAGVPATVANRILDRLRVLCDQGVAVLVVEHNLEAVMRVSDHVHVLVDGRVIASAPPSEVQADERVLAAYLGA